MKKRIFSLMLALTMLTSCGAMAETTKHERVFAVVNAAGDAQTVIDSIHLENADKLDVIEDKTALAAIENAGGHETFAQEGDRLTWQAHGSDIIYRGNGDSNLYVTPVVTCTLDGAEISAADLKDKTGDVTVNVAYKTTTDAPFLAVSALLLDESQCADVTAANATLVSDGSRSVLVGWAVPGMDSAAGLPDSFSFSGKADHLDLTWMMTAVTSSPLTALTDAMGGKVADASALKDTLTACLTALKDGTAMPEGDAELTDIFTQLSALKTGASQLSDGVSQLQTGLTTLTDNSAALNDGASQIMTLVLSTANTQLAAAGLDAAGITVPELTADNYDTVLQAVLDQLNPDALKAQATAAATEKVKAAVMAKEADVRAAVTQAVQAKVLEGVLAAAGLNMDAETYAAAKAGKVTKEQAAQLEAAVTAQMATDAVKAQLEAAVTNQIDQLVAQNVASEDVQKQISEAIAPAEAGREAITALKAQLASMSAFVNGIKTYTDGVATAATGAAQLSEGSAALSEGISTGLNTIADKALPLLTGDVTKALDVWSTSVTALSASTSYDLVADGMAHDLVFIIRSDLTK